jgi:uncharacterized membrane protein YhaH (DUF805 family)
MNQIWSLFVRAFQPSGRFTRREYGWVFWPINVLTSIPIIWFMSLDMDKAPDPLGNIFAFALIGWIPFALLLLILASIQRLHDLGRSGWFVILGFVPIVSLFVTAYMLAGKSKVTKTDEGPPAPPSSAPLG